MPCSSSFVCFQSVKWYWGLIRTKSVPHQKGPRCQKSFFVNWGGRLLSLRSIPPVERAPLIVVLMQLSCCLACSPLRDVGFEGECIARHLITSPPANHVLGPNRTKTMLVGGMPRARDAGSSLSLLLCSEQEKEEKEEERGRALSPAMPSRLRPAF